MEKLTTEDRFAIMELVARYNYAADYGDANAWADTFAADGTFEGEQRTPDGTEKQFTVKGRDELKHLYNSLHEKWGTTHYRHWNNNHLMEGDGDTASHTCYFVFIRLNTGSPSIESTAVYNDKLKKIDGEWKFSRRTITWD